MTRLPLLIALLAACGPPHSAEPYRAPLDGDRPIELRLTEKARAFAAQGGKPDGARLRMIERVLPRLELIWNPDAAGPAQVVLIDFDEDVDGPCATNNWALWSPHDRPAIWLYKSWIHCLIEGDSTLYGEQGCFLHLLHELGHNLGSRAHAAQHDRARHDSGSVMCGWASDCVDHRLADFTDEDRYGDGLEFRGICGDGGHGGPCS